MKTLMIITLIFIFGNGFILAQDSLLLMNGRTIAGNVQRIEKNKVFYQISDRNLKIKKIDVEDLFRIEYQNKSIEYFYEQDTSFGYNLTIDEMYTFIMGESYAKKNFKAPLSTLGGFISGMTGGVIGFWGFTIPTAYTIIEGAKNPRFVINEKMLKDINTKTLVDHSNIEKKYETTFIEVQEISLRSQENVEPEIDFKQRELERIKSALKQLSSDEIDIKENLKSLIKDEDEKESILEDKNKREEELVKKNKELINNRDKIQESI